MNALVMDAELQTPPSAAQWLLCSSVASKEVGKGSVLMFYVQSRSQGIFTEIKIKFNFLLIPQVFIMPAWVVTIKKKLPFSLAQMF